MARVAFYTFGILKGVPGDPVVQGFFDALPSVFGKAAEIEGFISRARYAGGTESDMMPWGDAQVEPRFAKEGDHGMPVATLSLWADLESVSAFAYHGPHGEAMKRRREWLVEGDWPSHVAWWVEDGHTPTWAEAVGRFEALADNGDGPEAFRLAHPYDGAGQLMVVDREVVRARWTAANG